MIKLCTDGSAEGLQAGCASIVRIPEEVSSAPIRYIKTIAYLGQVNSAESELFGAVIGLCVLKSIKQAGISLPVELTWYCDHQPSRRVVERYLNVRRPEEWRTAAGEPFSHQCSWQLFENLQLTMRLTVAEPLGPMLVDHKACDRASRWARRGGLSKKTRSGLVGRLAERDAKLAWWYIDASEVVRELHAGTAVEQVEEKLIKTLSKRVALYEH